MCAGAGCSKSGDHAAGGDVIAAAHASAIACVLTVAIGGCGGTGGGPNTALAPSFSARVNAICRRAVPPRRAVKGGRITDLGLENAFVEPGGPGPPSDAEPLKTLKLALMAQLAREQSLYGRLGHRAAETHSLEHAVTQGTTRLDALERRLGIYDCERPNSLHAAEAREGIAAPRGPLGAEPLPARPYRAIVHFKSYLK
jgi:hypothetical protein